MLKMLAFSHFFLGKKKKKFRFKLRESKEIFCHRDKINIFHVGLKFVIGSSHIKNYM